MKSDNMWVKLIKCKWNFIKIAHPGNSDTVAIQVIPDMQLEQLQKWNYQHKLGKWLWQKEWRYPRGDSLTKYLILKKFTDIFYDFESVKDKMLEADANLERSMIIHQDIAKLLTPY